jgi:hypothetical protein
MIRSLSAGSRLVAYSCSHPSTSVAAAWSPGPTSTTPWSGSWEMVTDTKHLVALIVHEG